jgi:hypothetical protein
LFAYFYASFQLRVKNHNILKYHQKEVFKENFQNSIAFFGIKNLFTLTGFIGRNTNMIKELLNLRLRYIKKILRNKSGTTIVIYNNIKKIYKYFGFPCID